jgi:hypothetical protein
MFHYNNISRTIRALMFKMHDLINSASTPNIILSQLQITNAFADKNSQKYDAIIPTLDVKIFTGNSEIFSKSKYVFISDIVDINFQIWVFWVVTPSSLVDGHQVFKGTYTLHRSK